MPEQQYRPTTEECSPEWLVGPELPPEWDDPQDSYGNAALAENLMYGAGAKDPTTEKVGKYGNQVSAWGDVLDVLIGDSKVVPGWGKSLVKGIGLAGDGANQLADGRGVTETIFELGGKEGGDLVSEELGFKGPIDTGINYLNDVMVGIGMEKPVTDATSLLADLTASKTMEHANRFISRGLGNLISGDDEAMAQQGGDLLEGDYGTPLQGYGALIETVTRLDESESVEDVEGAFDAAGSHFDGGVVETAYDEVLGDGSHAGSRHVETPEDGTFEATSGNDTIDWICRDLIGL